VVFLRRSSGLIPRPFGLPFQLVPGVLLLVLWLRISASGRDCLWVSIPRVVVLTLTISIGVLGGREVTVIKCVVCFSGLEIYSCVVPASGEDGGNRMCECCTCCMKDCSSIHFMVLLWSKISCL